MHNINDIKFLINSLLSTYFKIALSSSDIANIVSYVCCIAILVGCIILDLVRNPLHHARKFVNFRTLNWVIVGLSYACCYMARYCVSTANRDQIFEYYDVTRSEYGVIVLIGNISYGISVFINGFLVDILGAKLSMVISCIGSGASSILSGMIMKLANLKGNGFIVNTSIWYLINNYFQTFSTSAIVKFGAYWYHITERGFFSGIFGVVISFGFFLAFQVDGMFIANDNSQNLYLMFIVPGCLLFVMALLNYLIVRAIPEDKFEPEIVATLRPIEEQYQKTEKQVKQKLTCQSFWLRIWQILKPLLKVKILFMLAIIEIFLGYIRDGTLSYYSTYFNSYEDTEVQYIIAETGVTIAGMFGSLFTGIISDLCFKSQRQPVAVLDFSMMAVIFSCLAISIVYDDSFYSQAILISLASFAFQGVNGILTSTMAMDFANKDSTGFCAGFLDAIQKIGSSLTGAIIPAITEDNDWKWWPISFVIVAIVDIILFIPIINIKANDTLKQQEIVKRREESQPLINQAEE